MLMCLVWLNQTRAKEKANTKIFHKNHIERTNDQHIHLCHTHWYIEDHYDEWLLFWINDLLLKYGWGEASKHKFNFERNHLMPKNIEFSHVLMYYSYNYYHINNTLWLCFVERKWSNESVILLEESIGEERENEEVI